MSIHRQSPTLICDTGSGRLTLAGCWTTDAIADVECHLADLAWPSGRAATVDASAVDELDTGGAWLIGRILDRLERQSPAPALTGFDERHRELLQLVRDRLPRVPAVLAQPGVSPLERIGRAGWTSFAEALASLAFFGEACVALLRSAREPARIRWAAVAKHVMDGGWNALPIIGLLAFLIGVVIAYQGGTQLRNYGADIFIVDLVTLTQLRELGPLLVAIIVAGRTGSAYAAQIGTMRVSEEIDALRSMGVNPVEVLVLPRIIALVVVLPLLGVFADFFGVFGGMVMAVSMLDLSPYAFLERIPEAVSVTSFLLGVCKLPVFAVILGVVGCFQGFQATGGADSVGMRTTLSVVQSIFLVIVADAVFSVIFTWLNI